MASERQKILIPEDEGHWKVTLVVERCGYGAIRATSGAETISKATAFILMSLPSYEIL